MAAFAWLALELVVILAAPRALAQTAFKPLSFEVASVKVSDPGARISNVLPGAGGSLTISNVPFRKIILYAFDIRDFQLAGGPGWIDAERYDIVAKTGSRDDLASQAAAETDDQRRDRVARVRERLRSLLADRFALRVHEEQRERTVLALRIAKGGPKLAEAAAENQQGRISTVDGRIQGFGAPISMLVTQLSMATGLVVEDETGLRGKYDFVLDWAPDEKEQNDTRPSIYTGVVERLGLRLDRAKGLVRAVIIDHVERPSAN